MISVSPPLAPIHLHLPGYTVIEPICQGAQTRVYRGVATATGQSVVIKILAKAYPSFRELVQFCNQYTITKNLSIGGIVQPLGLEVWGKGYALIMEDGGEVDLRQYVRHGRQYGQQVLNLPEILDIGRQLAGILHQLHCHRVIHKDIKPANILIHPETKQIKLIDFSIASLLPQELPTLQNPHNLEGNLAYMAPEQTGRMNRAIDYRTDFYGLGVTLYELLTEQLPFTSSDPLELLHSHLALIPTPVDQVNPAVPGIVAAIVAKLMAKNGEDRYQSALGLQHDLLQCLAQYRAPGQYSDPGQQSGQYQGEIAPFPLAQQDFSDRFTIPQKLYGRQREVQTLLAAFDRICQGAAELVVVAGFSGIGKTAVVNQVHKPITRQQGYFIQSKFDQFNRNIPFSAFGQAFRSLMDQLLAESDQDLANWKTRILATLGDSAQVLVEMIPQLEQIIGPQPPVPELSGMVAQNRLDLLLGQFIKLFATPDHPLVIFLDDLQWADSASLNFLTLIFKGPEAGYLLVLGAYRHNEVCPGHGLMLTLEALAQQNVPRETLNLTPLKSTDVQDLVADVLGCGREGAAPLSRLVYQKTQGNPFFTTQFLQGLHNDGHITFDAEARYWQCDLAHLQQLALTDDVVTFMVERLQKLPLMTQEILRGAACMGNEFDLATLAMVCGKSQTQVATDLWRSLQLGLVIPNSQTYKFFHPPHFNTQTFNTQTFNTPSLHPQGCHSPNFDSPSLGSPDHRDTGPTDRNFAPMNLAIGNLAVGNLAVGNLAVGNLATGDISVTYHFLHDRVQQAAYDLIPTENKPAYHWQVGQLLLQRRIDLGQATRIFDIVSNLNQGIASLDRLSPKQQQQERQQLAQLNLQAAQRARETVAYAESVAYLKIGIDCLSGQPWQHQYPLILALCSELAEVEFLRGEFEAVKAITTDALPRISEPEDALRIYIAQISSDLAQGHMVAGFELGLQALSALGIELPQAIDDDLDQIKSDQIKSDQIKSDQIKSDQIKSAPVKSALVKQHQILTAFKSKTLEQLIALPQNQDPKFLKTQELLTVMVGYAYKCHPELLPLIICQQVSLLMHQGNIPASASIYATYGMLLSGSQDFESGFWAGQVALALGEAFPAKQFEMRLRNLVYSYINPWKALLRESLAPLKQGFALGLEAGDIEYTAYGINHYAQFLYFSGCDLTIVDREIATHSKILETYRQEGLLLVVQFFHQAVLNLIAPSDTPWQLEGDIFQEHTYISEWQEKRLDYFLAALYINKLVLAVLFGKPRLGVSYATTAQEAYQGLTGEFQLAYFHCYRALACLQILDFLDSQRQDAYGQTSEMGQADEMWAQVAIDLATLEKFAHYAPMNFQHQVDLVKAERHRVLGQSLEAMDAYDRAIANAQTQGYIQEEAFSNELAAQFYLTEGRVKIAALYLQEAYYCYGRWGAEAKVQNLEQRYSELLQPILPQPSCPNLLDTLENLGTPNLSIHSSASAHATRSKDNTNLNTAFNFAALLKSAQALSESLNLEQLLEALAPMMLQNAGADQLVLVLPEPDDTWQIRAIATAETTHLCAIPWADCGDVPRGLLQYVRNTQEVLVIDDLETDLPIIDAYLQQHQPRSILGLPIVHQGSLKGLLYLQNQTATGVFSPDRLLVLNFLCSQAAIALTNAQLFQEQQQLFQQQQQLALDLQVQNRFFHVQQESSLDGILVVDTDHQIRTYNQRFVALWSIPDTVLASQDYQKLFNVVLDQVQDPSQFLDLVQYLDDHPQDPSHDEINLKDQRVLERYSSPVQLPSGEYSRIWYFRDISDRKQGEQLLSDYNCTLEQQVAERTLALEQSQQDLRDYVENAATSLHWVDANGIIVWANQTELDFLGYDREDYIGQPIAKFHADNDVITDMLTRLSRNETLVNYEARLRCKDGAIRYVQINSNVFYRGGEFIHTRCFTTDITERKAAEVALNDLVAGTATTTGEDFFPALVRHISTALGVPLALVTQFVDQELQSLAFVVDGELQPNFTYDLPQTPCVELVMDYSYHCPQGLSQRFPQNPHRARGMESYLGVALRDRQGQVLGSLCIFDRQPLDNPERAQQILNVFGSRAAAELERQRMEKALESLVAGTALTCRDDFFPTLVRYLTQALGVSHALIAERIGNDEVALAYMVDGTSQTVQTLPLQNTPQVYEQVYEQGTYHCEWESCQTCAELVELGVRSYLGVALHDRQGNAIGLLAIFHRQILPDPLHAEQILRVFAARAGAELERQRTENALQNLIEGTAASTGPDFFAALVRYIAEALKASHAFVTEVVAGNRLHFLAAWADGQYLPNQTVDIAGTTCALALEMGTYHCARDVVTCFPDNPRLAPMGVESYQGVALQDPKGRKIGTLCIFARQPIADPERSEQILRVFAARAAAELERLRAQTALQQLNRDLEQRVEQRTQELARSEQDLRTLFNNVYDAIFVHDLNGNILDVNNRVMELFGATREEILTSTIADLSAPDAPVTTIPSLFQQVNGGTGLQFEWKSRRLGDGGVFDVEVSLKQVMLGNRPVVVAGIRDISDRKQLELDQARLITVLETTPDFIGIASAQGEILWHNKCLRELRTDLGNPQEHRTIADCHPDWVNQLIINQALPTAIEQGSWQGESALLDGEGQEIPVSQVIIAHKSPSGEVERFSTVMRDISDRKRAERALQLSEARANVVFTQATVGIFETHLSSGKLTRFNDYFCTMLGYSPQELLATTFVDLTYVDDQARCGRLVQQLEAGNISDFLMEKRFIRKDGSLVWVLLSATMMQIPEGDDGICLVVVQDISDRKTAEGELVLKQNHLEALLNNIPHIAWIKDAQSRFIAVNQPLAELLNCSPSDMIGKTDYDFSPPEIAQGYQKDDSQVLASGQRKMVVERHQRGDGSWGWLETTKTPFWDGQGQLAGTVGIAADISERKRAEQILQEEQLRLKLALDAAQMGTWSCSLETGQVIWSHRAENIFGFEPGTFPGDRDTFAAMVHPDDYDRVMAAIAATFETATPYQLEYRIRRLDGEIRWIGVWGRLLSPPSATSPQLVGVVTDISDRKAHEERLEQTNAELLRATRMKDEFLATMSHELRTPLNAILGMTEILQEGVYGPINSRQLHALNTVEHSGVHLLELINDILDLSKISADKLELVLAPTNLAYLCHGSLQLIQQQAKKKSIQIQTTIPRQLPAIIMDEQRINQVLINLLSNAVKFTPEGGQVSLVVHPRPITHHPITHPTVETSGAAPSPFLRITVNDTGIGIAPEHLDQLFQPFVQIDSALNRKYQGTGLGLALVKRIVELHQGRVWVTSEVGVGSSFKVELPWLSATSTPASVQESIAPPKNDIPTAQPSPPSPLKDSSTDAPLILLVEDDAANVLTISSYLEAKGYRLSFVENGQEALEFVQTRCPSLILMDIQMPVMDGLEAIKQIRQDLGLTEIPIVALTALAMKGDQERCLEAGANEYLSKPVKLKYLDELVQRYLKE